MLTGPRSLASDDRSAALSGSGRPTRYFGAIRSAPSSRMTSPLSISFSTMEQASRGELGRLAQAVGEGHGLAQPLARLLGQRREQLGVEQARRDGHDADALVGQVARRRQRHADDAALGGRVGDLSDLPVVGGGRRGVDAHAALARVALRIVGEHGRGGEAEHVEGADQVDPDDGLEGHEVVRPAAAGDLLSPARAGAAHADAQPAAGLRGLLGRGLDLVLVADVGVHEGRAVAELVGQRLPALVVDVGDGHARAAVVQPADGRLAEPRRPASDKRSTSLDFHGAEPYPSTGRSPGSGGRARRCPRGRTAARAGRAGPAAARPRSSARRRRPRAWARPTGRARPGPRPRAAAG